MREEVIDRCLPLAEHIARKFAGRGELFEDLLQVARVGLLHAVDRFDVARGTSFLSFAVPTIMGEVRRYFRDNTWSVRVPRRV
ncbi:sigma-70 family RNA polymerase sigma factor, partial [Nocardia cyriacigeorgica]